jgi:L-2,4-diaminobutyric acid acetyltransferase
VAVDSTARGQGLGKRMLTDLLERLDLSDNAELHTTITPSNRASWALFESLARDRGATLSRHILFDRDAHLDGSHESEVLVRIGPLHSPTENYRRTA